MLGRRIGASGRTSAFVAGRAASAADLRALGSRLLAFYGQHEHRQLTLASAQLEILDGFAGAEQLELRERYRAAHAEAGRLARELAELREREGARERDLDLLRFELSEIEAAAPDAAEEAELAAERERLRHAEGLREASARAVAALNGEAEDGGARAALGGGRGRARRGAGSRPRARLDRRAAAGAGGRARGARRAISTATSTRSRPSPGGWRSVEERLDAIERLKRKHGGSIEQVLEHAEHCRAEIARLENASEIAESLQARIDEVERRARGARRRS